LVARVLIWEVDFSGLRKIVNTATIVLFGISLLGWGLSQFQENTPLTIDEVRSNKLRRHAEEVDMKGESL
jgi:hypothetical protein